LHVGDVWNLFKKPSKTKNANDNVEAANDNFEFEGAAAAVAA
jgi:hypothetical protein